MCIDGFRDGCDEGCKRNEMSSLLTWVYMKELALDLVRENVNLPDASFAPLIIRGKRAFVYFWTYKIYGNVSLPLHQEIFSQVSLITLIIAWFFFVSTLSDPIAAPIALAASQLTLSSSKSSKRRFTNRKAFGWLRTSKPLHTYQHSKRPSVI